MAFPTHSTDLEDLAEGRESIRRIRICRAILLVMLVTGLAVARDLCSQEAPNARELTGDAHPIVPQIAIRMPDRNAQMQMNEQQVKKANFDAANTERKRQIADDSARLLKLANDLKAEVDKTSKDTLSLGVIRKAEEIEKLARAVKEKMKLTMNSN